MLRWIYKLTGELPHVEGDVVKADAGHVGVEKYISEVFSNWASFRPQYMIGSGNNKDCEEWFFDRLHAALTNISHVRDLASISYLHCFKSPASSKNISNCAVTLMAWCYVAKAAGLPVEIIIHYDLYMYWGDFKKKSISFSNMHFYAEPRAAKEILGWSATTNLPEDLKERFDEYVKIGRDKKDMKFELDDKILEALKVPVAV
ncbi:hypothetical protein Leryth_000602 [Lithospermum erythrorhizon]|nr:hypothetical protein Leryth_000602 [Lithospermum erythrorhizon]